MRTPSITTQPRSGGVAGVVRSMPSGVSGSQRSNPPVATSRSFSDRSGSSIVAGSRSTPSSVSSDLRNRVGSAANQTIDLNRSSRGSSRLTQIDPPASNNAVRSDIRGGSSGRSGVNSAVNNTNSFLARQGLTSPNTSRTFYGPSSYARNYDRNSSSGNDRNRSGSDRNWSGNDRNWSGNDRNWSGNDRNWSGNDRNWSGNDRNWSGYDRGNYYRGNWDGNRYRYGSVGSYGYRYGSGYRPYYGYRPFYPFAYTYGYGYPWGIVASRLLLGLPYLAYSPFYNYGYRGYSYYGGYGGYYSSPYVDYYSYQPTTIANHVVVPEPAVVVEERVVEAEPQPNAAVPQADFALQGETDFKAGNYESAIRNWQHALIDDPGNAAMVLMLGQAFFATGKYDEAAGAIQQAMTMIPEDRWDVVVKNRGEIYGNQQNFAAQLKALEAARDKEDSPALRFLLGYQYGFSGSTERAIAELDKTLEMAPQDETAKRLRDKLSGKPAPAPAANNDLILPPPPVQ